MLIIKGFFFPLKRKQKKGQTKPRIARGVECPFTRVVEAQEFPFHDSKRRGDRKKKSVQLSFTKRRRKVSSFGLSLGSTNATK